MIGSVVIASVALAMGAYVARRCKPKPVEKIKTAPPPTPIDFVDEETAGQRWFVSSDTLPVNFKEDYGQAYLAAAGVKFLGPVPGKKLFQRVELPPGWKRQIKRSAPNSYHTSILDERGRERACVFYKAASHDQRACLYLAPRFRPELSDASAPHVTMRVFDSHVEVFKISVPKPPTEEYELLEARNAAHQAGINWLNDHHPNWQDPTAYWDD